MKHPAFRMILRLFFIQVGAVIAAFALEELLIPNKMLDGGITGLAIIGSHLVHLPLAVFLIGLNLPFIALSYRLIGRQFVLLTIYAIASLSVWVTIFHPMVAATNDPFLGTIFGGIILGIGVGIIIRNGGCLDGTEIVAIILNKRIPYSVGEIIMVMNIFVFGLAALVFGLNAALYSVVVYLIAYRMIDLVVEGIDESKSLFIVSSKPDEITRRLISELNTGVTLLKGQGGFSREERDILYLIARRLEVNKIKDLVKSIDEHAFITVQNVHEVIGKNIRKK